MFAVFRPKDFDARREFFRLGEAMRDGTVPMSQLTIRSKELAVSKGFFVGLITKDRPHLCDSYGRNVGNLRPGDIILRQT